jgi:RNA polymerase sigma-70 factor (ECF subfamily)
VRLHGELPERRTGLDEESIRDFLTGDYRRLVAGLSLASGSQATAEDAVQEALARAWERAERGERIVSLKAWVAVVATNIMRSGFRRVLAERRAAALSGAAILARAQTVAATDDRVDVARAIKSLPRRQREVLILRYFADLGLVDIARALGSSEGAVKATLHRARGALARALGEPTEEEETDRAAR